MDTIVPQPPATPLGLTIAPYGVEVFTDLERGKQFVTLHFRRRDVSRAKALALIGEVMEDLTRAGLTVRESFKARISGDNPVTAMPTSKTKYDCYLEAPVQLLADVQEEERRFVEAMQARYGRGKRGNG